ncbi:MAG: guanosine-3',5'-bis(diphosphate) 3'-pyrophosphohydrolase [Parcubacteria bacterium C7867-003]|nr:MAG: guanosine-3',5'-bis(diphosphate) 3'-pyrophosphohydrolase [Parcubacteria bacterium C7867-003]
MNDIKEIFSLIQNITSEDKALLQKAYDFAVKSHEGHTRKSGEPYFNHLFGTAKNIASLNAGVATIVAGFLHDSIEDTEITPETIEKEFGKEILFLVEGVTKLGEIKYRGTNRYNESMRKFFLAMSQDLRVLIIKLCDRLHNMQTLSHVPKEKQLRIAKETLEIYAPLAYRLGIKTLQRELEDLAFAYVYPKEFEEIKKILKKKKEEVENHLDKFEKSLKKELAKNGITEFKMDHRVKSLYSLYKKLQKYKWDVEAIYDISALRVTVKEVSDCYRILGIVHGAWRPLPGRIKDYIASPKLNGYRSIHTTIFTGDGGIIEVQIRTEEMHKEAEYGVASHLSYKEGKKNTGWIQELVEFQNVSGDEFLEHAKKDFFEERIFVFTPIGDVIDLPKDSSVIDFAYNIHTDIGNHMVGAKVNGKFSAITTILQNGDRVEVETKKNAKPNKKWIESCKTTMAKRRINNYLENNK